eukprot:6777481-Prymnesium_polylepis.1
MGGRFGCAARLTRGQRGAHVPAVGQLAEELINLQRELAAPRVERLAVGGHRLLQLGEPLAVDAQVLGLLREPTAEVGAHAVGLGELRANVGDERRDARAQLVALR